MVMSASFHCFLVVIMNILSNNDGVIKIIIPFFTIEKWKERSRIHFGIDVQREKLCEL